jgi:Domain of unknown function (DUF4342)
MNVDTEVAPESPEVTTETVSTEEFRVKGDELVTKIKELLHEGNIRRIIGFGRDRVGGRSPNVSH